METLAPLCYNKPMGLDVYVGSLTRYYSGNWQTILQQLAPQTGIPVRIVRPTPPGQRWYHRILNRIRPTGPAVAAKAVKQWQEQLQRQLALPSIHWNEDPEGAYFTDKPAWDCYGALVLWAAYNELPNAKRRETAQNWHEDSAYQTTKMNPGSRYRHLVADTEIWLPLDFLDPIRTTPPSGDPIVVGSSIKLLSELQELNARTWVASDEQITEWRQQGAEHSAPLETSAQFGFACFYELTKDSVEHNLPMKLDY